MTARERSVQRAARSRHGTGRKRAESFGEPRLRDRSTGTTSDMIATSPQLTRIILSGDDFNIYINLSTQSASKKDE